MRREGCPTVSRSIAFGSVLIRLQATMFSTLGVQAGGLGARRLGSGFRGLLFSRLRVYGCGGWG